MELKYSLQLLQSFSGIDVCKHQITKAEVTVRDVSDKGLQGNMKLKMKLPV